MVKLDAPVLSDNKNLKKITDISTLFLSRANLKNEYQLEVIENHKQYKQLLKLRKTIFVDQEGYPFHLLRNNYERVSVHILAKRKSSYVGAVSIKLDDGDGLPLTQYVDLKPLSHYKIAEIDKLGVVDNKSDKTAFYELISAAYGLIRFCGYNAILIFTLKKKSENICIYKKIGFKQISEFRLFDKEQAVAMILDLDKTKGIMWKTNQLVKAAKRLLSCVTSNTNA